MNKTKVTSECFENCAILIKGYYKYKNIQRIKKKIKTEINETVHFPVLFCFFSGFFQYPEKLYGKKKLLHPQFNN